MTKGSIIKNVNVIDVKSGNLIEKQDVTISNGRVEEIKSTRSGIDDSSFHAIDGTGKFLLPGFADLHVHLNWDGGCNPRQTLSDELPRIALLRAYQHAIDHLAIGVTTLFDVGSGEDLAIDLATAIRQGIVKGPRLFASGRIICIIGGHGAGLVHEVLGYEISGKDEALRATRTLIKKGADYLKISATSGAYGNFGAEKLESIQLDPEEIRTITSEAAKYNIRVSAHALNLQGIKNSVDNGVKLIHHGAFLDQDTAKEMHRKKVSLVPTLLIYSSLAEGETTLPSYIVEKAKKITKNHREAFMHAMEQGVNIAGGTDAYSPNFGPRPTILDEAITMGKYGMPNKEVLKALTLNAAEALGNEKEYGSIEQGKVADLVMLKENPLVSLENIKKTHLVLLNGEIVNAHLL